MKVYLVRHGKAYSKSEDPSRSLTGQGRTAVERMAAKLEGLGIEVGEIRHSGKTRAKQTAEILAKGVNCGKIKESEGLAPNDPVDDIHYELVSGDSDIMIVGHLPFMGILAARLLKHSDDGGVIHFSTATVAALEKTPSGDWTILWVLSPEIILGR